MTTNIESFNSHLQNPAELEISKEEFCDGCEKIKEETEKYLNNWYKDIPKGIVSLCPECTEIYDLEKVI